MKVGIERLGAELRTNIDKAVKAGIEPWRVAGEIGQKAIKMFVNPQDCVLQLEASQPVPPDQLLMGVHDRVEDVEANAHMRQIGQQRLCETALNILKVNPEKPAEMDIEKIKKISTALDNMPGFSVHEIGLEPEDAVVMGACIYAFTE